MKYNNIELPKELGFLIFRLLSDKELHKLKPVCKNWNTFFSDDNFWKLKLLDLGVSNPDDIKNAVLANNYKETYQKLVSTPVLFKDFFNLSQPQNLHAVNISHEALETIKGCAYIPNSLWDDSERISKQSYDFCTGKISIFSSLSQFISYVSNKDNDLYQPKKITIDHNQISNYVKDKKNPLEDTSIITQDNKALWRSLSMVNSKECGLILLHKYALHWSGSPRYIGPSNKSVSLIPTGRGSLYFTCLQQFKLSDEEKSFKTTDINLTISFVIEITPNQNFLLNYCVSSCQELLPIAQEGFNNQIKMQEHIEYLSNNPKMSPK